MEENNEGIFNIGILDNKLELMSETIKILSKDQKFTFVVAHMISLFIDGLVAAPKGDTGVAFKVYLNAYFPELTKAIGADMFYSKLRCKAAHEFAVEPPLALARCDSFQDKNTYAEWREKFGQKWLCLNVDRLIEDFLNHIDILKKKIVLLRPK